MAPPTNLSTLLKEAIESRSLKPKQVATYADAVRLLVDFLDERGMPLALASITREHLTEFVADQLARHAPATALLRYTGVRRFFAYLVARTPTVAAPNEHKTLVWILQAFPPAAGRWNGDNFKTVLDFACVFAITVINPPL